MLDCSQRLLIQFVIPLKYCSQNRNKTALLDSSSSVLEEVSSLRRVFLLSSDDPGPRSAQGTYYLPSAKLKGRKLLEDNERESEDDDELKEVRENAHFMHAWR